MNCNNNHITAQHPMPLHRIVLTDLGGIVGVLTITTINPMVGFIPYMASACIGAITGEFTSYLLDKKINDRDVIATKTETVPITKQPVVNSIIIKDKID